MEEEGGEEGAGGGGPELEDLWRDHARPIFGYLARRVGRQSAEDLTSEVFVRAARALPQYKERGVPVRAWLFAIARNLVAEFFRRRGATPEHLDGGDGEREEPAPGPDPGDVVSHGDDLARAMSLLKTLPPAQQEVIDLRFLRELTVAETAQVLGSGEEAVRALTYRALKALRRAYGAAASDDDEVP